MENISPKIFRVLLFNLLMILGACTIEFGEKTVNENDLQAGFICPMDCENGKVYEQETGCPKCHMALKNTQELN